MSEHYFSGRPTSEPKSYRIPYVFGNRRFIFLSSTSVFSSKKIDYATDLLIRSMVVEDGDSILDMGCGYGPIGILAAYNNQKSQVLMVEINERAVSLARKNIKLNNIANATVVKGDFFEKLEGRFDVILMNPPIAIGLRKIFEVVKTSKSYLKPSGSLQVVARHNKGGARIKECMKEVFGNVEEISKAGGFRVYMSVFSK
ncbi:MAG: class I SAM-dependent methyltransferase [Candidatus Altiarchaeota archaeon]|nr:class I SAM-dependent methyltransferase [Candidatus Altiarchaeota archaeon]